MDLAELSTGWRDAQACAAPQAAPLRTPVPFGHWLIAGNQLACRQPRKCVTVRAPRRLLREVMTLCDGARGWQDVVDALGKTWAPEAVAPFLEELAQAGALVEAGELWAHWGEVAQLPQANAPAASPDEIAQLPLRAEARLLPGTGLWDERVRTGENAFAATLRLRESIRTFDDAPVTQQVLCSILWAAHGVARTSEAGTPRWHRTVASGGNMHSVRWFVVVLRSLPATASSQGALPPGVYEARFHVGGGASLQPVDTEVQQAWTCLRDPRVLRHASALVLPLCDVAVPARKYGNRATLFAALEAGQCLQNAQLMAASLDAGSMVRGDTVASVAIALTKVPRERHHWLSMPGLVVGAMPSAGQKRQQRSELRLKLTPNLQPLGAGEDTVPRFAFAAVPEAMAGASTLAGSGRAADPRTALDIAEAEAWERVGWATLSPVVEAAAQDLPHTLDPRGLVAYSARQHRASGFPFLRFDPGRTYLWCESVDTDTGAPGAVPAECVHALHALPSRFQDNACTSISTSGLAAGTALEDALMRATLELVERDAFCRAWLSGVAAPGVDRASLPADLRRRIADLEAQGVSASVVDLSTPWCMVVAVFLQSEAMPFTAITAAAAFDAAAATGKALSEAEGRLASVQHLPRGEAGPDPMRTIEDYYRHPRTFRRSDFFRPVHARRDFRDVGRESAATWEQMRSRMRADGLRLLCTDITPAGAAIQQGRRPLKVVRVLVPGLVPIWFQRGLQPAGLRRFVQACAAGRGRPAGHFLHPFT